VAMEQSDLANTGAKIGHDMIATLFKTIYQWGESLIPIRYQMNIFP